MTSGGRNLLALGVGSIIIAMVSSGLALMIYHGSGDIYLDRSRPGFLPDKTETKIETEKPYSFPEGAKITEESLDKYLAEYDKLLKGLFEIQKPFGEGAMSDTAILGIPEKNVVE